MDRRQQRTREAIFAAFTTLLSKKRYTKITIQEIIDEANIGRSTFYAHFETKDDLLKELCTDLFGHVFSESLDTESTHDFSLAGGDAASLITHILYHLKDNKRNITAILTCESGELFLRFFKEYLDDLIVSRLLSDDGAKTREVPLDYLVNHIAGSFLETVRWWLKDNMKESPEEMAKYFLAVITPLI